MLPWMTVKSCEQFTGRLTRNDFLCINLNALKRISDSQLFAFDVIIIY